MRNIFQTKTRTSKPYSLVPAHTREYHSPRERNFAFNSIFSCNLRGFNSQIKKNILLNVNLYHLEKNLN